MSESAGGRLRAARRRAGAGIPAVWATLRWDEREQQHVDAVVQAAEHVEVLQQLLDEELGGGRRPTTVVKLTSEIRLQQYAIGEHLGRVQIGDLAPLKSPQHQAAAVARWGANRPKKRGA